jgi:RES domain-containing protein
VSRHRDPQGAGGLRAPGRWHERGLPIVYLAESPAGALLEACVHTSANDVPPHYTLLMIEADDEVLLEELDRRILPADWPKREDVTQAAGTAWLRSLRTTLLRVPSALVPATCNVLLNPLRAHTARIRIQSATKYPFDARIKR